MLRYENVIFFFFSKSYIKQQNRFFQTIRVALGLNKATLKHRMCLGSNTWISQLIDFFNVVDYAIPGYNAKDVLTELHVHLWDCAIDYRYKGMLIIFFS